MSDSFKDTFDRDGYVVARGLFGTAEVDQLREHYMTLRRRGSYERDLVGVDPTSRDPLRRYPRMAQMHRWDDTSLRWLLDARLRDALVALVGSDPYAVQTMLYFKPAGARGQALHQDNYYLRADPGTCVAAWMALDRADEANGCMLVVPGSHRWPILCVEKADTSVSFTDVTVPLPPGQPVEPVVMEAGDVLFFNGSLVHGSAPNSTTDRFRRALIGHYIQGDAQQVATYYHPALRMDGTPLELEVSPGGGACGVWTDGEIALTGHQTIGRKHE
ncbi:phytanoyl-CoA dioxygenase family protein [Phytohabitans aurantiacus]|nr:phytanoyl-CoA dioxygenase family protein [Phytohabitans aurantiacus]